MCKLCSKGLLLGCGYYSTKNVHTKDEVDYSKYLGPKWKELRLPGKRVPCMVSNHISFIDAFVWGSVLDVCNS